MSDLTTLSPDERLALVRRRIAPTNPFPHYVPPAPFVKPATPLAFFTATYRNGKLRANRLTQLVRRLPASSDYATLCAAFTPPNATAILVSINRTKADLARLLSATLKEVPQ